MALPLAVYARDSFVSLYRVRGSSMHPVLHDGDVVIVARCDFFPRRRRREDAAVIRSYERERERIWRLSRERGGGEGGAEVLAAAGTSTDADAGVADETAYRDAKERESIRLVDAGWERHDHDSLFRTTIPTVRKGDVVVFRSPNAYPVRKSVKRVVSTGGQRVRPRGDLRTVRTVPQDCLWVEGDNSESPNEDSCTYGPVNKRLILGRVERIVWPPSRWGTSVERKRPAAGRVWSPGFDDDGSDYYY